METSGWWEGVTPCKVVWKCVTVECGEQCVVICGDQQMQLLCADNLATQVQVSIYMFMFMYVIYLDYQEPQQELMLHLDKAQVLFY